MWRCRTRSTKLPASSLKHRYPRLCELGEQSCCRLTQPCALLHLLNEIFILVHCKFTITRAEGRILTFFLSSGPCAPPRLMLIAWLFDRDVIRLVTQSIRDREIVSLALLLHIHECNLTLLSHTCNVSVCGRIITYFQWKLASPTRALPFITEGLPSHISAVLKMRVYHKALYVESGNAAKPK